jgi:hypothetical protein
MKICLFLATVKNREPKVYTSHSARLSFPLKISTTFKEILSEKSVSVNGGIHLGASHEGYCFWYRAWSMG